MIIVLITMQNVTSIKMVEVLFINPRFQKTHMHFKQNLNALNNTHPFRTKASQL